MNRLRWLAILISITLLGITGFQAYWLKNNYDREKQNLEIKTNAAFRQTILRLQALKLKLERAEYRTDSLSHPGFNVKLKKPLNKSSVRTGPKEPNISMLNLLQEKMKDSVWVDSSGKKTIMISFKDGGVKLFRDSTHRLSDKEIQTAIHSAGIPVSMDTLIFNSPRAGIVKQANNKNTGHPDRIVSMGYSAKSSEKKKRDTGSVYKANEVFIENTMPVMKDRDEFISNGRAEISHDNWVYKLLYNVDSLSLKDSITLKEITAAYAQRLNEDKIPVAFSVSKLDSVSNTIPGATDITIGFLKPVTYHLSLQNTFTYLVKRLTLPILFSLVLIGITVLSFLLLYRNLLRQRRLAILKNEFISNITHELKTPIATVGVAIEALKNFNAIHDPQRTKEYLDISSNELQRLSLLVDKVLKLSMFEKKEIDLKYETVNMKDLVNEVMTSMRLQIEKYHANVSVTSEGDLNLQGDRLHLLSVVFNLLDNALKYSKGDPAIQVDLKEKGNIVEMSVTDNGIGIPDEYKNKLFEKFFRVPAGDTHNAKGYGLGLSYAAQVLRKHNGTISVESHPGTGSKFFITLPKQQS